MQGVVIRRHCGGVQISASQRASAAEVDKLPNPTTS